MLLKLAIGLFVLWLAGVLLLKGSFIHVVLLTSIAIAAVHFARRHRCGEPMLSFKPGKY